MKPAFHRNMVLLFTGSSLFQTVQIGTYPILLSVLLDSQNADGLVIGLILSASWVTVILSGSFIPGIIRQFGFGMSNGLAVALTIASLMLLIISDSWMVILISSVCMGFGLIVRWIVCDTLVIAFSDEATCGKMIGYHEALMGLGIGLGPLSFTFLGVRETLYLGITLCVLGQIIFWFLDTRKAHNAMKSEDSQTMKLIRPGMLVILCAAFVAGYLETSAIALMPIYFGNFGFTIAASAVLVSGFGFGGTFLQPPLGNLADKMGSIFAYGLCAVIIVISAYLIILTTGHYWLLLAVIFMFGGAAGGLNTLAVIQAGKELPSSLIPAGMTGIAMLYTLGCIIGPVLSGLSLESRVPTAMMLQFAVLGVTIGAVILGFKLVTNKF